MVKPNNNSDISKKSQVEQMFDSIAPKYDFLNHFLSMGIDNTWRRKAIKQVKVYRPNNLLDIATGTGDFAVAASKLKLNEIVGIDISERMLAVGVEKMKRKNLDQLITLQKGDSENLVFEDATFDSAISGFGVRNFENLEKGLSEIHRVLKPRGICCILEFSKPKAFPIKQIYNFYFHWVLPKFGKLISKDSSAYTYLPESVDVFPEGDAFVEIMKGIGFKNCRRKPLSFGIASLYLGEK